MFRGAGHHGQWCGIAHFERDKATFIRAGLTAWLGFTFELTHSLCWHRAMESSFQKMAGQICAVAEDEESLGGPMNQLVWFGQLHSLSVFCALWWCFLWKCLLSVELSLLAEKFRNWCCCVHDGRLSYGLQVFWVVSMCSARAR